MSEASESTGASSGVNKSATVQFGMYSQPGAYVGMTVAQLRAEMSGQWKIPKDAKAMKGKTVLDENHVIQPGDNIAFHRAMGEKGTA